MSGRPQAMSSILRGPATASAGGSGETTRSSARIPARGSTRQVLCDDGVRLHVELDAAPGTATTVVFVHGVASSLQEFDAQRAALSGHANLVLYDHRGHGDSETGHASDVSLPRLARDLATVLAETTDACDRVVLIAHSLGGMVTLSMIADRPEIVREKIAALALMSTAAERIPEVAAPHPLTIGLVRTGAAHGLLHVAAWCAPALDALKPALSLPGRWWLRWTMFGRHQPPPGLLEAKQELWAHTSAAVIASTYRSLLTFDRSEVLETLRQIPVLLVTGTDDRTIPARRSRHLTALLGTTAELLTVRGAGHTVNQTHAPAVNEAIHNLIRRSKA